MGFPDKIYIVLTYKHDPSDAEFFTEQVGAVRHGDYYRLIHVPAFARNLAVDDIVKVEFDDDEYHFDELIEESGNSTLHIVIFKLESKEILIQTLCDFECGVNTHVADTYLVVNVSSDIFYQPIQNYLRSEKMLGNIDFRESCLSRIHARAQN